MKIRNNFFLMITVLVANSALPDGAFAQQYKLTQVTSVMNMRSESTVYVKGMRKRTEGGGYAGMENSLATIEQCDLRRTITLNDKKKLYYIEPFSNGAEELKDEEQKPPTKNKPTPASSIAVSKKGGTVTISYNLIDSGERKKMYGLTARRVLTTLKMNPSPEACTKDSMQMMSDGWYIDLPQFNCPIRYSAANAIGASTGCSDRFVTRRSGKGKEGFPLMEKRTMVMGNQSSRFETELETIEFSTAKLDSMLFEIPPGYTLVKSMRELQDEPDIAALKELYENSNKEDVGKKTTATVEAKRAGVMRIGVLRPDGVEQLPPSELQAHIVNTLTGNKVEALAVSSAEEAKKLSCDLMLTSKFEQVKQASKLGGVLKAVKNVDPYAASSYNIQANFLLSNIADGSNRVEKRVSGKFEGTADGAARKALDEGTRSVLRELNER